MTSHPASPTEGQAQQALQDAQRADMLARTKGDPLAQAVSQTAFAKVFLLQGEATAAIEQLQPAFD